MANLCDTCEYIGADRNREFKACYYTVHNAHKETNGLVEISIPWTLLEDKQECSKYKKKCKKESTNG